VLSWFYSRQVAEISEFWDEILNRKAGDIGAPEHRVVADFIALKATNDEIRQRAVDGLIASFTELAAHANRHNVPIEIDRKEPHNFAAYGANMVGIKTSFRHGIRCLSVEAGWTRLPGDGFMRGGALAVAHVRHFGLKQHGMDLALLKTDERPAWFEIDSDNTARPVKLESFIRHMSLLIDRER
jgi:hypothetical protein